MSNRDIRKSEQRVIIKLGGMMVTGIVVVAALVKFSLAGPFGLPVLPCFFPCGAISGAGCPRTSGNMLDGLPWAGNGSFCPFLVLLAVMA